MKARYRTKLELYMNMLSKCKEPLLQSGVCRKCNLSHYDASKNLDYLVSRGMLATIEVPAKPKNRLQWQVTTYGLEVLRKLEEAHSIFEAPMIAH